MDFTLSWPGFVAIGLFQVGSFLPEFLPKAKESPPMVNESPRIASFYRPDCLRADRAKEPWPSPVF